MSTVLVFEKVSKCYKLGHTGKKSRGLVGAALLNLREKNSAQSAPEQGKELWALNDISFSVEDGDAVGFVGKNGAGKSTLMKIISRITRPTSGRVTVRGRVGSLLEVGTGFHPELTGRENIYLNGSIMGLKRSEILRSFDSIVDFSELEHQLDTPVKFYSSGQYMRLGFAVAAHLNQEIMIVDEVLAVGDATFQEKCRAKMRELVAGGRTILFVSHDMKLLQEVCRKAVWLHNGTLIEYGEAGLVAASYERSFAREVPSCSSGLC